MITVVIIGILGAIGAVSYSKYVERVKVAESYDLLGNIAKAQKSYFYENRKFCSMGQNASDTDNFKFVAREGWNAVGYPAAIGTSTYFSYRAVAGKETTSSYTGECTLLSDASENALSNSIEYGGGLRQCQDNTSRVSNLGVNASPTGKYDWVMLVAKGNLKKDTVSDCKVVIQLLQVSDGTDISATPFIEFNIANPGR